MSQRTRILASFAHQLRNALGAMSNNLELIRLDGSSEESIQKIELSILELRELAEEIERESSTDRAPLFYLYRA